MEFETNITKRKNNMKETIGEKIKRLRKEMGLTQENVHNNQSQISQIESGRITNPDENTLLLIAKNMDMAFEDLISDTTWVKPEAASISKEFAFSPAAFDIEVDDMLNISYSHKSFPLYDSAGNKNKYCIYSGVELIDKCENCGTSVINVKQQFCSGCGKNLFEFVTISFEILNILSTPGILTDYFECKNAVDDLTLRKGEYESIISDVKALITTDNKHYKESLIEKYKKVPKVLMKITPGYLLDNIAKDILAGNKIELTDLIQHDFNIQIVEALIKKLKYLLKKMEKQNPNNPVDDIKTDLIRSIAIQIERALEPSHQDPTSKELPSVETMMGMIKDLSTTEDSDELVEKLQSKIDIDNISNENNNDEENSENGNSETAAENKTEQDSNNAKNKDDKESNND